MKDIIAIARIDGKKRRLKPFLHPRKKRSARAWAFGTCVGAMLLVVTGGLTPKTGEFNSETQAIVAVEGKYFSACSDGPRVTCVVDGDTLWLDRIKIRIADIDTPEVTAPRCAGEETKGKRATARLIELLNAGPFEMRALADRDEDLYGRKLRVLYRGGQSLGAALADEGLARKWDGRRRSWC